MKTKALLLLLALTASSMVTRVNAPSTAFTYQGRLNDGAGPANGSYDLQFTMYDAASGGSVVGGPIINPATAVKDGLFTVTLDFGAGVFTGAGRCMEIAVRPGASAGTFTTLTPRQTLTAAPYALYALTPAGP